MRWKTESDGDWKEREIRAKERMVNDGSGLIKWHKRQQRERLL